MSFQVSDIETDSNSQEISYFTPESPTMSAHDRSLRSNSQDQEMIYAQQSSSATLHEQQNQLPQNSEAYSFSNIPPSFYQALRDHIANEILNQLSSQIPQPIQNPPPNIVHGQFPNPINPAPLQAATNQWAVWDGSVASFSSFLLQVKIKIEEERVFLGSNRSICLNIFSFNTSDKTIPYPALVRSRRT